MLPARGAGTLEVGNEPLRELLRSQARHGSEVLDPAPGHSRSPSLTRDPSAAEAAICILKRSASAALPPTWSECQCVLKTSAGSPGSRPRVASGSLPKPLSTRTGRGPASHAKLQLGNRRGRNSSHSGKTTSGLQ
jgi:hypothetical protein